MPATPTGIIVEAPYRARVNELGHRHPVTRGLPGASVDPPAWARWFRLVAADASGGETIMTGPNDNPLLVLSRVNDGRVALLLSDHVWLWARAYENGGPHGPLLRRLAHWLMQEPDLEEEVLKLETRGSNLIVKRQTLNESTDPVTVTTPTGKTETLTLSEVEPGLWQATMKTAEVGLYSARAGKHTALASVGPANPLEYAALRSTDKLLAPLTAATGGSIRRALDAQDQIAAPRVVTLRRAAQFSGSDWIGLKTTNASVLKGIDRFPLLAGLIGLALLIGALSMTWFREGR